MRIPEPPVRGRLLKRYKRFLADVELKDGTVVTAHCPNTGSLLGCVDPGNPVILRHSDDPKRKLAYTFQAVRVGGTWVNVHTGLPNALVAEAVEKGRVPELAGYDTARREVKYGKSSRIDLLLERAGELEVERCYVEVKSTTLALGGVGLFPDAVTERGRKHLGELAAMVAEGHRAVQLFVVSRDDVRRFRPADHIDPAYGTALREAADAGVELLAYTTRVLPSSLVLDRRIEVELAPVPSH